MQILKVMAELLVWWGLIVLLSWATHTDLGDVAAFVALGLVVGVKHSWT